MPNADERRKFPRLDIPEEARVFDENGRELGVVAKVSGGGIALQAASLPVAQSLEPGSKLRITIKETGSRATNVLDVIIRQRQGSSVGMEFVDVVPDKPL
jgi:hypothetical protein